MPEAESESACSVARIVSLTADDVSGGSLSCVSLDEATSLLSVQSDSGAESRVTVDHAFRDATVTVEDLYQDAIYPFTESLFQGLSTVLFTFGVPADRARLLYDRESQDQGMLNLAAEQVFTNVKAASGSGMQFLVHTSVFAFRKDKVIDALAADGSSASSKASFSVKEREKNQKPELRGIKQEVVESQDAFDAIYERCVATLPPDAIRVVVLTVEMNEPDARGVDRFRQGSLIIVDVSRGTRAESGACCTVVHSLPAAAH